MNLPSLSEQIKRFGEDVEKWLNGELKFVTRTYTQSETPELSPDDIKRIREGLNMSQAEFGRLLGAARRTVEGWEQGTRTPRPGQARQIDLCSQPRWIEFWRLEDPPDTERPPTEKTETSAPLKPRSRTKPKSSTGRTRTVAAAAPKRSRRAPATPTSSDD